ncbi:MAG: DNA polymerase III subunit gamma/tau [Gammaproteobacteria bacterium]|nr:DNA polymerase III subunit gamma/tau [Gammaproteobacteria bacterium]
MSYQVLARKLRPADFASLVGQDHIVRALQHGLDSGRLHHAYLFTGTRGVGKTTIARILAKCLNCEAGVSASPCGECSVCREVQENRFVDLIEVDAASRTRVDDTRELLDNAQYLPTRGRYKIYLIDEVHMLSASSFNALLKTLEEPPEHVKFLLATTDPKKVPITVLSRCLQFQLKNIAREKIAAYLADAMTEEGIEFEAEALEIIAKAARGSMRDALSVTDQAIAFGQGQLTGHDVAELLGAVGSDEVAAVLDAIESGDPQAVVRISQELAERAADFEATLTEVLQALHGIAVANALGQADGRPALSAGSTLSVEAVQLYYQIALTGYRDMRVGPDPKTVFEMTLLRMLAFAPDAASAQSVPPATSRPEQVPDSKLGPGSREPAPRSPATGRSDAASAPTSPPPDARAGRPRSSSAPAQTPPSTPPKPSQDDDGAEALASQWLDWFKRLNLSGPSRAIAEHSVLIGQDGSRYRLRLDEAQEALFSGERNPEIEQALAAALGQPVEVRIETGALAAESPAKHRERLRAEQQAAARRQLEQDQVVQSLITEFDGRLENVRHLGNP